MVPNFITGASSKVVIDNVTMAYASDTSYQVSIDTVPVETMGRYEVAANEPVGYTVAGEFSIVRYTAASQALNLIPGGNTALKGNGLGAITAGENTKGDAGGMSGNVNPGALRSSHTWDLNVYQKGITGTNPAVITIHDCRVTRKSGGINKRGVLIERISFVGVLAEDDSFASGTSSDIDLS